MDELITKNNRLKQMHKLEQDTGKRKIPQLLKWVGNKQKFAEIIVQKIPNKFNRYIEPFLGTGAILGTIKPKSGISGDLLKPLIDLWIIVKEDPETLSLKYRSFHDVYKRDRKKAYNDSINRYNKDPNPFDLLFISRSCYGGVMRFTMQGTISTPIGPHNIISPITFDKRVYLWHKAIQNTRFYCQDFKNTMKLAEEGDIVYCDPPYYYGQSILYGAQKFDFEKLWDAIEDCKSRGVKVLLSFDGKAKQGVEVRKNLFERYCPIDRGFCMLNRFKRKGLDMNGFKIHDWLFTTW